MLSSCCLSFDQKQISLNDLTNLTGNDSPHAENAAKDAVEVNQNG